MVKIWNNIKEFLVSSRFEVFALGEILIFGFSWVCAYALNLGESTVKEIADVCDTAATVWLWGSIAVNFAIDLVKFIRSEK